MLKKLLTLLLATALLLCIVACGPAPDNGDTGNQNQQGGSTGGSGSDTPDAEETPDLGGEEETPDSGDAPDVGYNEADDPTVIYSPAVSVSFIKSASSKLTVLSEYAARVCELTGKLAIVNSDLSPRDGREIVFGETTRPISKEAKEKLDYEYALILSKLQSQGVDTTYYTGFAIYCTDSSVALVWLDDAESTAIAHFADNFLSSSILYMEEGFLDVQVFSTLDQLLAKDEADIQAACENIVKNYGEGVLQAVKNHLSLFDERFYLWLADLYDPGKYDEAGNPLGGGFYYSNSGRDTMGFGIDLESTRQALSFLSSAGMLKGTTLAEAIPEKMQKEMIAFVLSLQSPVDGYFYHPQWGTNISTSRRSRDLSWATSILSSFGYQPYWNTPNGVDGIEGEPPGEVSATYLSSPFTEGSAVSAASKVLAASGVKKWNGAAHLATLDAWEEYILNYASSISTSSYSIGNNFSSQSAQIITRDALAVANGELPDDNGDGRADGGYIETFEYYFNSWQNPDNGLWEKCSVEDGTVYYNAINGLMKISGAYNSLGIKLPHAEKALECAVFMVTYLGDGENWADSKGKSPTGSVDVYNPWVAISNLLGNIKKHGSAEESDALRATIKANALELITVTTTKVKKFAKEDGSYGYTWTSSPANSQSAPVAVPNTIEGDVNGGGIAFTGVYSNMCSVLGISGLKPFGRLDLAKFLDRCMTREHIDKEIKEYTFDSAELGLTLPENVGGTEARVEVVRDELRGGNALQLTDYAKMGTTATVAPSGASLGGNTLVLEFDVRFTSITVGSATAYQIKLGKSYMLVLGVTKDGVLTLSDSSSTNGSISKTTSFSGSYDAFSWNTIRVEYRMKNASTSSTETKVYVNGNLVGTSTNYLGNTKTNPTSALTDYSVANFYALNATDFVTLFDNVKAYKTYVK